jgi:hypothetical protein
MPSAVHARAALERGRRAFEARSWTDAHAALSAADEGAPLGPDDLELLAAAAYLVGREDELLRLLERAHQAWADAGDVRAAARTAIWLGIRLTLRREAGSAFGWLSRRGRKPRRPLRRRRDRHLGARRSRGGGARRMDPERGRAVRALLHGPDLHQLPDGRRGRRQHPGLVRPELRPARRGQAGVRPGEHVPCEPQRFTRGGRREAVVSITQVPEARARRSRTGSG